MRQIPVEHDFEQWRRIARRLLRDNVKPEDIDLVDARRGEVLFDSQPDPPAPAGTAKRTPHVPRRFIQQAETAADHRDADRWQFLYRLLWRLTKESTVRQGPGLLGNLTDPDVLRLDRMCKSIGRDVHKMHAFVRFRKIDDDGRARYVAFHRPDHYIVRRTAGFFRERFGSMDWAIFTPDDSVAWNGKQLRFGPGIDSAAARELVREDSMEEAWKTYYGNIFNPARIKLDAMRAEMPKKHWATLPETQIIPDLLQNAPNRVENMMAMSRSGTKTTAERFIPPTRTLPVLRDAVQHCKGCELCEPETVTQAVFGEGPSKARIVFVGEQPGDQEDLAGKPFVGPAGQLMNDMLDEAGVDRKQVYITNTVKHFRHEMKGKFRLHQKPLARHINACKPWLEAEMETITPDIVVALGSTAAQAIMGRDFRVTKSRGQWMTCPYAEQFMATIHPSAILRVPDESARDEARAAFVSDLKQVAERIA